MDDLLVEGGSVAGIAYYFMGENEELSMVTQADPFTLIPDRYRGIHHLSWQGSRTITEAKIAVPILLDSGTVGAG